MIKPKPVDIEQARLQQANLQKVIDVHDHFIKRIPSLDLPPAVTLSMIGEGEKIIEQLRRGLA
jgi:hypothetical protein